MKKRLSMKSVILSIIILLFQSTLVYSQDIKISAAASLESVIKKITQEYNNEKKDDSKKFSLNFGASGMLRNQIENGADIDIVFFADTQNMDKLISKNLISEEKSKIEIFNSVVFVGNKKINSLDDIKDEKIAVGDPKSVPAGKYALEFLDASGYKEKLKDNFVYGKDVRSIANYLELGEVEFGILYKTELKKLKDVKFILDDKKFSPEVKYSFAILKDKNSLEVMEFYNFLQSEKAIKILQEEGYIIKRVK